MSLRAACACACAGVGKGLDEDLALCEVEDASDLAERAACDEDCDTLEASVEADALLAARTDETTFAWCLLLVDFFRCE